MVKKLILDEFNTENPISLIADIENNEDALINKLDWDKIYPILPLRNMVLFPNVVMPVSVGRKSSLKLVREAYKENWEIAVFCQKQPDTDFPEMQHLHTVGTMAKIVRLLEMPDNSVTVILQGLTRINLEEIIESTPYLKGRVLSYPEIKPEENDEEYKLLTASCKDSTLKYVRMAEGPNINELGFAVQNISSTNAMINFICTNLPFSKDEKMRLLLLPSLSQRAFHLLELLNREIQYAEIKASIVSKAKEDIDQQQREYFLQQQMRTIQNELGDNPEDNEYDELYRKGLEKKWGEDIAEAFKKELAKLSRMNPQSPDYSVQINYLQTMLNLPWNEYTEDNLNIKNAEKTLNKDHFGLKKVKERILEHLSVLKLKKDFKAPIICLYGPPGVGKTSLGKSIAAALKRKYIRMSLGGVHDEAEIRGHRKTYIGAMPGRIIKGLIKAGSSNPVFILDEIDKVSSDRQGDPSSALLEVLDPEQNNSFHDNYLDLDYDLSKVMFIATANNIGAIPQPLLDRMELIEVTGYITEEKIEIARKHLIPKALEANGLDALETKVKFTKPAIEKIIESYTRESGVRELEKKINKIMRREAWYYADNNVLHDETIKPENLSYYLGKEEYIKDVYQGNDYAGVVTGLAWTAVGGEILFIETSLSKGKGNKLTLTGNLGDVMKESAMLAFEYIHSHAQNLGIEESVFENWNVHVHVPEGAIPKDGPSAGITMAVSIASALTQRKVRKNIAMTGEITLRGLVLPVGGIKEKILAAKRAGITDIVMSKENERDIDDIEPMYIKGLTFHYVTDIKEVLEYALLDEKVKDALDLSK